MLQTKITTNKTKAGLTYKQEQEQIRQKGQDMKENKNKTKKNNEPTQRRQNNDTRLGIQCNESTRQ